MFDAVIMAGSAAAVAKSIGTKEGAVDMPDAAIAGSEEIEEETPPTNHMSKRVESLIKDLEGKDPRACSTIPCEAWQGCDLGGACPCQAHE